MKKCLKLIAPAALLMFSTNAFAGEEFDLDAACTAYADEKPEIGLDCTCLVDDTGDDVDILASFEAAVTEDAELSEDAGQIFVDCAENPPEST